MTALYPRDSNLFFDRCKWPQGDSEIPDDRLLTAHSLECDDIIGIARELLEGWLQGEEESSVHTLTDRTETVQGMEYENVAWHCGGGNQHGSGHEIVGRAAWSAEQWGTDSMDLAFRSLAKVLARKWVYRTMPKFGITHYPEWLSLAQIADGQTCGLCTHNDMRLVYGGTTHTDPGPNYPYQKLRDYIHAEIDALLGNTATPSNPDNGTDTGDWFDMASLDDLKAALKDPGVLKALTDYLLDKQTVSYAYDEYDPKTGKITEKNQKATVRQAISAGASGGSRATAQARANNKGVSTLLRKA